MHGSDYRGESDQPTSLCSSLQFASALLYPSPREWRPDLSHLFFRHSEREREIKRVCRERKIGIAAAAVVGEEQRKEKEKKMVKMKPRRLAIPS